MESAPAIRCRRGSLLPVRQSPEFWMGGRADRISVIPETGDLDGASTQFSRLTGRCHLERVLDEYVDHYNHERPHRGLQLHPPNGQLHGVSAAGAIRCRSRLSGLLRAYSRVSSSAAV